MPVVDDEYLQLAAALNAALASDGSTFVAIELGAWCVFEPQPSIPSFQRLGPSPVPPTCGPKFRAPFTIWAVTNWTKRER